MACVSFTGTKNGNQAVAYGPKWCTAQHHIALAHDWPMLPKDKPLPGIQAQVAHPA